MPRPSSAPPRPSAGCRSSERSSEQARAAKSRAAELEVQLEAATTRLREIEESQRACRPASRSCRRASTPPSSARPRTSRPSRPFAPTPPARPATAWRSCRHSSRPPANSLRAIDRSPGSLPGACGRAAGGARPCRQQIAEHVERAVQAEQKATSSEASEALASAEAEARDAQERTAQFETELAAAAEKLKEMRRADHNLEARVGELQERARTGEVHDGLTPVEARLVEVETALMNAEERAKEAQAKERTAQERIDAAAAELAATEANMQQLQEVYDVVRLQAEDLRLRQAGAGGRPSRRVRRSRHRRRRRAERGRRGHTGRARARDRQDPGLGTQLEEAASVPRPVRSPPTATPPAPATCAAVVAELEERLEQTEVRARRAYTAAEAAEAALRFAKESGEVVSSIPASSPRCSGCATRARAHEARRAGRGGAQACRGRRRWGGCFEQRWRDLERRRCRRRLSRRRRLALAARADGLRGTRRIGPMTASKPPTVTLLWARTTSSCARPRSGPRHLAAHRGRRRRVAGRGAPGLRDAVAVRRTPGAAHHRRALALQGGHRRARRVPGRAGPRVALIICCQTAERGSRPSPSSGR